LEKHHGARLSRHATKLCAYIVYFGVSFGVFIIIFRFIKM
jgi:hypothetical protein